MQMIHNMGRAVISLGISLTMLAACGPKSETKTDSAAKPVEQLSASSQAHAATGTPAMWLVRDADTNVYLFGTIHLLKPDTKWVNPKFETAFVNSDAIYQEANVDPEVTQQLAAILPGLALYSDGRTLLEVLDDEEEKEVLEAGALVGLAPEALDRMKPWYAAIGLAQMQLVKSGYTVNSGVETIITKKAKEAGKPLRYLETAEQQLRMLADLPEDSQIEFLVEGAKTMEETPDMLDQMVAGWSSGNVDVIAKFMADPDVMGDAAVYDAILTSRNRDWTTKIKTLMDKEAGTFMIAVGAAHLAGEDSVIEMLRARGETVTRQ